MRDCLALFAWITFSLPANSSGRGLAPFDKLRFLLSVTLRFSEFRSLCMGILSSRSLIDIFYIHIIIE